MYAVLQTAGVNMRKMERLLEGFQIFLQYEGEDGDCSYEHDEIFAGNIKPGNLKPGHAERLEELGWSWNGEFECWHHF